MPDTMEPPVQWMTIAKAAEALDVSPNAIRRAVKRGKMKATRRTGDNTYLVEVGTSQIQVAPSRAGAAGQPTGATADAAHDVLRTQIREESARLHEQLSGMRQLLEERFLAVSDREREAWRVREAELERRIATERAAGERRVAESREETRATVERAHDDAAQARREAEQARLEREQERECHRGAELAWMTERRAQLARIDQLERAVRPRPGLIARLLRRHP